MRRKYKNADLIMNAKNPDLQKLCEYDYFDLDICGFDYKHSMFVVDSIKFSDTTFVFNVSYCGFLESELLTILKNVLSENKILWGFKSFKRGMNTEPEKFNLDEVLHVE